MMQIESCVTEESEDGHWAIPNFFIFRSKAALEIRRLFAVAVRYQW